MAFDLESGIGGAQAGLAFGPFGALVGGLFGGLFGGRQRKRAEKSAKREARRRESMLMEASSPEYLLKTAAGLRPGIREALLPQSSADVATINNIVGQSGMRETGVGALVNAAAERIPDVRAVSESLRQAGTLQSQRIAALGGAPTAPTLPPSTVPWQAAASFGGSLAETRALSDLSDQLRRAAMPPEVPETDYTTSPYGRVSDYSKYGPGF